MAGSEAIAADLAGELISFYGESHHLVSCSEKFAERYTVSSLDNATLWQIYPELSVPRRRAIIDLVMASGMPRNVSLEPTPVEEGRTLLIFCTNHSLGIVETRTRADQAETGEPRELERALLRHQATHDVLTGLSNRRQFSDDLNSGLPISSGGKLAVLQIDLDDFKPVNDTLGHGAGDTVLKLAAARIKAVLREAEIPYRLGGDEFAVLQWRDDQPAEAERLAESLVDAFRQAFAVDGIDVFVGASIGIAIAPQDGNDGEQLMKAADIALYAAKREGRARARTFNRSMLIMLEQREMLRRSLRVALEERQFFIEYQPIFEPRNGVVGFEALLRWQHPFGGIIPPSIFIPMAETDGLMGEIGQWVLEQACRQALTWPSHFTVAVNLSPAEFSRRGFTDRVAHIIDTVGLPADRLELEITETVLLEPTTNNLDTLHTLELLGFRISLDDFGTHYSSLGYLKSFPFDTIKIDKYFIKDIETDQKSQTIVRFVIALAHGLGMRVTAEGVENARQAEWLARIGCDRLQGYFLHPPMPAETIGEFLRQSFPARLSLTR